MKNLENKLSVMSKKVKSLEKQIYKHEQCSHRNSLSIHGKVETDDGVTNNLVIEAISRKTSIVISPVDLDQIRKSGKKNPGQSKTR